MFLDSVESLENFRVFAAKVVLVDSGGASIRLGFEYIWYIVPAEDQWLLFTPQSSKIFLCLIEV